MNRNGTTTARNIRINNVTHKTHIPCVCTAHTDILRMIQHTNAHTAVRAPLTNIRHNTQMHTLYRARTANTRGTCTNIGQPSKFERMQKKQKKKTERAQKAKDILQHRSLYSSSAFETCTSHYYYCVTHTRERHPSHYTTPRPHTPVQ